MTETKDSWIDSLKVYKDIRMVRILLLGAISGFPWVLIASSLSLWLKEEGLSRSTIGWAGLIFGVYAFNFLWAPIIDRIQIPVLTKKLGHRRGWIVLMQVAILVSLVVWSYINPTENFTLLIAVGLIIAIASATQDITVDALRIEQINENEGKSMAAGAAMAVVGWWTGYKLGGVIALFTAEYFENMGVADYWQATFLVLGVIIILMNIGLMFVHETTKTNRLQDQKLKDKEINEDLNSAKKINLMILGAFFLVISILELLPNFNQTKDLFPFLPLTLLHISIIGLVLGILGHFFLKMDFIILTLSLIVFLFLYKVLLSFVVVHLIFLALGIALLNINSVWGNITASWISGKIGGPVLSFIKKNGVSIALGILGFVFLFKIGEAFLGRMSIVFYKEIGFSKGEIAIYSKALGWITTVVFTLIGGIMAMRAGTIKTMFFAGGLMALTNLLFALLAWTGKSELLFAIAVIADDITAAFATVAFVAFISLLVDRTYTATQYALLASIGTAGRTLLASSSGALVDWLNGDWGTFFVLTTLMVIPSLICLWFIRNKIKIGEK
jgi:PAT family beta-lactamase induction signal transducer AmpG